MRCLKSILVVMWKSGYSFPVIRSWQWLNLGKRYNRLAPCYIVLGFLGSSDGKASAYNAGDPGPISGSGRSPGEGNSNPLQYSCLQTPTDGGTW